MVSRDTYRSNFWKLVLAGLASLAAFYGLVFALDALDPGVDALWLSLLPGIALVGFVGAHAVFMSRIDEYMRLHHYQALIAAFGFALVYLGVMGARFHLDPGSNTSSGLAGFTMSIPYLLIFFYLWMAYWNVRNDKAAGIEE